MLSKRKLAAIGLAIGLTMFAAGCKKKVAVTTPTPPPPPADRPAPVVVTPPAPTVAQFTAEPTSIQRGQSATLRWEVGGNASVVSINQGVGTVQSAGSRSVSPSDSITYTLTATGPGGSTTASATVNVSAPPPAVIAPTTVIRKESFKDQVDRIQDAYFDYDKTDLRPDARDALTRAATALKGILADFPGASIMIEGHCDERGSAEYNLGLGDRRASSAKDFLQQLGVDAGSLKPVSYGKERPQCTDQNENCWQKNRRVHLAAGQ